MENMSSNKKNNDPCHISHSNVFKYSVHDKENNSYLSDAALRANGAYCDLKQYDDLCEKELKPKRRKNVAPEIVCDINLVSLPFSAFVSFQHSDLTVKKIIKDVSLYRKNINTTLFFVDWNVAPKINVTSSEYVNLIKDIFDTKKVFTHIIKDTFSGEAKLLIYCHNEDKQCCYSSEISAIGDIEDAIIFALNKRLGFENE